MALTPDRGLVRLLRGAVIALVASGLGVGLHVMADGAHGSASSLWAALPVALAVGIALANRRYTFWRAWFVLLALQPVIHLLSISTAHGSHSTGISTNTGFDGRMLAAHAVAAALAATWVATADKILWSWISTTYRRVTANLHVPALCEHPASITWVSRQMVVTTDQILQSASRRGPPGAVALRALYC